MLLAVHSDKNQRQRWIVPAETQTFLTTLLENASGLVEVAFCEGDPAKAKLTSAGWYKASELQRIGQTITRLASRYGDVYISLSQHSTPQRTYTTALPGRFLWLDDLKEIDPDAAMVLETSEGNYQALYRIDQALDTLERSAWQRRARACTGADGCSSDATHMIRVPGALNTKRDQNWRVRLAHTSDKVFSQADLAEKWQQIDAQVPAITGADVTSLSQADVAAALASVTELRKTAHRRMSEKNLARRTLMGLDEPPSQSEARYRIVYGLVSVGFEDSEIAALIFHWSNNLGTLTWGHLQKRSNADKLADIERCITKARAHLAGKGRQITVQPALRHRRMSPVPCKLEEPRARADRPTRLTAAGLLEWLEEERAGDRVLITQQDIASAFNCSTGTVKRVERQLTVSGHIQRQKRGRLTFVILLDHHRGGDALIRSSSRHDLIKISTNSASECAEPDTLDSINTPPCLIPHACLPEQPAAPAMPEPEPEPAAPERIGGVGGCVSNQAERTWRHELSPKELYTLLHKHDMQRLPVDLPARTGDDLPHLPVDLPVPEPVRYGPPSDPERRRRYYGLLGKAKKAKSAAQRRALEIKARELEERIERPAAAPEVAVPAVSVATVPQPVQPRQSEPLRIVPRSCGAKPLLTLADVRERTRSKREKVP